MSIPSVSFSPPKTLPLSIESQLINGCLNKLNDQIYFIYLEPLHDQDQNYYVSIEIEKDKKEPISIFTYKNNGKAKNTDTMISEHTHKIKNYFSNKENPNMLLLPSGAIIEKHDKISIVIDHGFLKIDNKIVLRKKNDQYIPLSGKQIHSYTFLETKQDNDLFIISDEYDKTRTDGLNDGLVFHLTKPKELKNSEVTLLEGMDSTPFINTNKYLILYRSKEEALKGEV